MNKNNTKKRNYYNQDILIELKEKYGYEIDYIRKSIRGDRDGKMSEQLKAEYYKLLSESKKTITVKSVQLTPKTL
ncbi:hypothetical protein [Flavobacterium columnare]|uniref:Uncharacterized protein n=1 Tax=Flavobacterium columnare TaxID=996 RepID=A0AAI8GAI2_9FLAO|nr:hypothetical protein [Flavobacterium columnare]AMO19441.1 hypothetical protein UN65_02950 [Flavobacterium columnare]AUX17382.1 hypothetical protein AQ623_03035 [Flavobacterium columnare]QOG56406.1 hypothetical protein HUE29_02995 [Flavobacterium columnare]QOG59131.1 hypothetical protein HUE30_03000 [Flavobacterium columnare]QOG61851.1 hypothetical protein HUE31_03000 [Flavobacterium columnare]